MFKQKITIKWWQDYKIQAKDVEIGGHKIAALEEGFVSVWKWL